MAAVNFPNNPSVNDTHTSSGSTWKWDGGVWQRLGTAGPQGVQGAAGSATISNNADNRVITGGSGTNLNGESALTFDGTTLTAAGSGGINISSSGADLTMNSAGSIFTGDGGNATDPAVANVSDTNTGFFYPAADTLAVTTGATERLRITSAGLVGVGIAVPAQKLHVYGNSGNTALAVGDNSTTQPYMLLEANEPDNLCTVHCRTDNPLTFKVNNSERLRIASDGKVNIGAGSNTAMNGSGLKIYWATYPALQLQNSTTGTNNTDGSEILLSGDSHSGLFINNRENSIIRFGTNNTERLRITSAGDVGIGYNSPTVKLHVREGASGFSGTYDNRYHITMENNGEAYLGFYVPDNQYAGIRFHDTTGCEAGIDYYYPTDSLQFYATDHQLFKTAGTERLRIDSSGRVLIGTATNRLGEQLHLLGPGIVASSAENTNMMLFGTFGSSDAIIGSFNSIPLLFRTGNTERLRIDTSGRVLIGNSTVTGAATLQVQQSSGDMVMVRNHATNYEGLILSVASGEARILASSGGSTARPVLTFFAGDGERLRIDTSGRLGVSHNLSGTSNYNRLMLHNPHDGSCWMQMTSTATGSTANTDGLAIGLNTSNIAHIWLRENSHMVFGTNGNERLRITDDGGFIANTTAANTIKMQLSNDDHGNQSYTHRGNRVLHSNGAGWDGNDSTDGADPILILSVEDRAGNSMIGDAYGICLHSESDDNDDYGPLLGWTNKSNSGNYNTTYAAIVGQKTGQGSDTNWSSGALHFFTGKPSGYQSGYMNSTADLSISQRGYVKTPRNPAFMAYRAAGWTGLTSGSKVEFNGEWWSGSTGQSDNYSTSNARFTAPVSGVYHFTVGMYFDDSNRTITCAIVPRINGNQLHNGTDTIFFFCLRKDSSDRLNDNQISGSLTLAMSENDYIEVYRRTGQSGTHQYYGGHSHFTGHFVG